MAKKPELERISEDELAAEARGVVHAFFINTERTSADVAVARVASSVLSTHAREKQAAGAADALSFMIARELASDKTQLEAFLHAAMPGAAVVRALPTAKADS
jgi:hypothetical protein